ncbi:hypothetical protein EMIT0180MI3_80095 [Priestia megaterium]
MRLKNNSSSLHFSCALSRENIQKINIMLESNYLVVQLAKKQSKYIILAAFLVCAYKFI